MFVTPATPERLAEAQHLTSQLAARSCASVPTARWRRTTHSLRGWQPARLVVRTSQLQGSDFIHRRENSGQPHRSTARRDSRRGQPRSAGRNCRLAAEPSDAHVLQTATPASGTPTTMPMTDTTRFPAAIRRRGSPTPASAAWVRSPSERRSEAERFPSVARAICCVGGCWLDRIAVTIHRQRQVPSLARSRSSRSHEIRDLKQGPDWLDLYDQPQHQPDLPHRTLSRFT